MGTRRPLGRQDRRCWMHRAVTPLHGVVNGFAKNRFLGTYQVRRPIEQISRPAVIRDRNVRERDRNQKVAEL